MNNVGNHEINDVKLTGNIYKTVTSYFLYDIEPLYIAVI